MGACKMHRRGGGRAVVLGVLLALAAGGHSGFAAAPRASLAGLWDQPAAMTFSNPRTAAEKSRIIPATGMVMQPVLPVFTPKYAAIYQRRLDSQLAGRTVEDPTANCLPPGFPRMMLAPFPIQIVEAPGQVLILAEYMSQVRRIYTDGRGHPEDPNPTFNGHSIGHWEGNVLVVDTVGLRGDTSVDVTLIPHSDRLHVTERIRRVGPDLEISTRLEDSEAFARPWETAKIYKPLGGEVIEYVCEENNRNPSDVHGVTGIR
jgi:hypothetical protein